MTEKPDNDNLDETRTHAILTAGIMVNKYRIDKKIGAGGMGEVYLAEDTKLDRKVALKFLPVSMTSDSDMRSRFIREAKATAKLNHPNIVTIYEVGEHEGRVFFAMEYVDGRSIKSIIQDDSIMLDKVLEIGTKICEGLSEAHKAGIVHRDIKAANIMVDRSGRPKILDFGLATISGVDQITKTGSTLGTIGYMSPEQVRGQAPDHRSDLFSFGIVLYEMIAGRRPHEAETEAGILNSIISEPHEPLSRYKSGVPDELERIIGKLLEKSPELRYQSASGVISDLRRLDITGKIRPSAEVRIQNERTMIVVLPFENLGPTDDEYFADGITEEIISRLAVVKKLGVISRTSAMKYKRSGKSISEIGRELSVDYVLEGTVRWSRGKEVSRVRITPQLIRVSDDTHTWADRYDRTLEDIFEVQSDIAASVIEQLNVKLLAPEKELIEKKPTDNMDAYKAYLRALEFVHRPDYQRENYEAAGKLFERAISLDQNFAHAHAGLATNHSQMYFYGWDVTSRRIELALQSLKRAEAIDDSLAEVHLAWAFFYYQVKRDYENGIREAEIAAKTLPIDPNWLLFAMYRRQGRMKEALKKVLSLEALLPNDPNVLLEIGITYNFMNDFEKAEEYLLKSESVAPEQQNSYGHLQFLYLRKNADLEKVWEVIKREPGPDDNHAIIEYYLHAGKYDEALKVFLHSPVDVIDQQRYWTRKFMETLIRKLIGEDVAGSNLMKEVLAELEEALAKSNKEARVLAALSIAYAINNDKDQAFAYAKQAEAAMSIAKDWLVGPIIMLQTTCCFQILGMYEEACDRLEELLSRGTIVTVPWMRHQPFVRDLENYPRFQELAERYGQ